MQPGTIHLSASNDSKITKISASLKQLLGDAVYDNWFHDKTRLQIEDDVLVVGVASPFVLNWMQKQFRQELVKISQEYLGTSASTRFQVDPELTQESISDLQNDSKASGSSDSRKSESSKSQNSGSSSNSQTGKNEGALSRRRYLKFSEFIAGSGNEMALLASRQVCEEPGTRYSPLYLYGGVGLGKTHLLESIHQDFRKNLPSLRVMIITAETFANYFTQALRDHGLPGFRQRFRKVDILLVDDIDFLDGKRMIQEEFLHTLKQLQGDGKQVVVTSNRHPRMLMKISDELRSRFQSGLVCRMESPDMETRLRIVDQFVSKHPFAITPEAKNFVARRFRNNVREIQGALNCLETYAKMTGQRVTVAASQKVLSSLERDCIRIVRMSDVEQTVCEFFGISSEDLKSDRRSRSVSQPRMLAMYLVRKHTQSAFNEIGDYFGGRNHSTVISAQKKVEAMLKQDATIKIASQSWPLNEVIESLESRLQVS